MLKDKGFYKHENRNPSDAFRELQLIRNSSLIKHAHKKRFNKIPHFSFSEDFNYNITSLVKNLKFHHILVAFIFIIILSLIFFTKAIFARINGPEYEINNNALNMKEIIINNTNVNIFKEQLVLDYNIAFDTIYKNNSTLPKGEEVVTKEGTFGKEKVSLVRTYKNQDLIEEVILYRQLIKKSSPQYVDVGTSEFLHKNNIHIGDTIYLTQDEKLKKKAKPTSSDILEIKQYMDVKLLDLPNESWCKVSFDNVEGYLPTSHLVSESSSPDIANKNRIQKIMINFDIDMKLNTSSGLTKEDYKKVFNNLSQDTNNVFKNNYKVFYDVDKKYNINGIFLAALAIHESAWGTSTIAIDKNNLFGFGAYDRDPYNSATSYSDYKECIESVAKYLVKYYLNSNGTKIYDDEIAEGTYFNDSPTLKNINIRYSTDEEWYLKTFNYMQLLYDKLQE